MTLPSEKKKRIHWIEQAHSTTFQATELVALLALLTNGNPE